MWSLFSKDPLKDFAYEVGELVQPGSLSSDKSVTIWDLHQGRRKQGFITRAAAGEQAQLGEGGEASIFVFDFKGRTPDQIECARRTFKRYKTLRHPQVVTFIDGLETDKALYIVTHPLTPLARYLQSNADHCNLSFLVSWGLQQVARAVTFLNQDCKLVHNAICLHSVYVSRTTAEWKLGALDFLFPEQDAIVNPATEPWLLIKHLNRYRMESKALAAAQRTDLRYFLDSYGFACLIWEIFSNRPPESKQDLREVDRVPSQLIASFNDLLAPTSKQRIRVNELLERCSKPGDGFFSNFFTNTLAFLDELHLKNPPERSRFFTRLDEQLSSFPSDVVRLRILPQLLKFFEFQSSSSNAPNLMSTETDASRSGGSAAALPAGTQNAELLVPLLRIGAQLSQEEFTKFITPCLVKLFACPDRSTRVKLLEHLPSYMKYLSDSVINEQLATPLFLGFLDTNPVLRDQTIKACVHLKARLNAKNIDELVKHLARLQQRDTEGGIRANAVVCLGKLAGHIQPQVRQTLLLAAFLRSTKDPLPPARLAGLAALQQTQLFFTVRDRATKVLPTLCCLTLDPVREVRDLSLAILRSSFDQIEKLSANPAILSELERDVGTVASEGAEQGATWAAWALSAFSSPFVRVSNKPPASASASASTSGPAADASKASDGSKQSPDTHSKEDENDIDLDESSSSLSSARPPAHTHSQSPPSQKPAFKSQTSATGATGRKGQQSKGGDWDDAVGNSEVPEWNAAAKDDGDDVAAWEGIDDSSAVTKGGGYASLSSAQKQDSSAAAATSNASWNSAAFFTEFNSTSSNGASPSKSSGVGAAARKDSGSRPASRAAGSSSAKSSVSGAGPMRLGGNETKQTREEWSDW